MTTTQTLIASLWPVTGTGRLVRNIFLAVTGSVLLWLSARVQVPFYPVPVTMQTFAVLAIGAAYGWRLAAATVMLYLAEGAIGLPVFAGNPAFTGGYLAGFVAAAALTGWLAQKGADRNPLTMFVAMLAGSAVIYLFGVAWLGHVIGYQKAVYSGLFPFLPGDILKAALAALLFPAIWRVVKKR